MIKNGALSCPRCGSLNVTDTPVVKIIPEKGDQITLHNGDCRECGHAWTI